MVIIFVLFFLPIGCNAGIEGFTMWDLVKDKIKKEKKRRRETITNRDITTTIVLSVLTGIAIGSLMRMWFGGC
ncbi:MAG: hypothetical protein V3U92_19725 [Cellulophaga sp.]